jgi:cyanophycinase
VASSSPAQAAKLYLMGGAVSESNYAIYQGLRRAAGRDSSLDPRSVSSCSYNWRTTRCPRVAVVTSAAIDSTAGNQAYASSDPLSGALSYQALFQKHGFSPKHVSLHVDNADTAAYDGSREGDANLALIEQADVVFFNGGDQARHARAWLRPDGSDTPLLAALRARVIADRVVVAGTSAGTAIMAGDTYGEGIPYGYVYFNAQLARKPIRSSSGLKDDSEGAMALRYFDNGGTMPGFGFAPAGLAIDTHFDARGRLGRLLPAMRSLGQSLGIGIDEDTAFFIDGESGAVYGTRGVFIVSTSSASFPAGSHFQVRAAQISRLTSGDRYSFRTDGVSSSKPRISRPYYSTPYDSADAFAAYELTQALNRVVDSTARDCRGTAVIPSYRSGPSYPSAAPTIRLDIYAGRATQGHYREGQYTAVAVLVDLY